MAISNVNRVKSIVKRISSNNADIIPIYQNNGLTLGHEFLPGYEIISYNCFIKNLKAYAAIRSLDAVTPPKFELTDSDTDKLYKTLDVEWKSPRKQLKAYISAGGDWAEVGAVSLLNPYGYPYRIYTLMDLYTDNLALELGDNSKIGIQMQNVGYGLLEEADSVTIHGSYVEEIFLYSKDTLYVSPSGSTSTSNTGGSPTPPANNSGGSSASSAGNSLSNNTLFDNNFAIGN